MFLFKRIKVAYMVLRWGFDRIADTIVVRESRWPFLDMTSTGSKAWSSLVQVEIDRPVDRVLETVSKAVERRQREGGYWAADGKHGVKWVSL